MLKKISIGCGVFLLVAVCLVLALAVIGTLGDSQTLNVPTEQPVAAKAVEKATTVPTEIPPTATSAPPTRIPTATFIPTSTPEPTLCLTVPLYESLLEALDLNVKFEPGHQFDWNDYQWVQIDGDDVFSMALAVNDKTGCIYEAATASIISISGDGYEMGGALFGAVSGSMSGADISEFQDYIANDCVYNSNGSKKKWQPDGTFWQLVCQTDLQAGTMTLGFSVTDPALEP